MQGSKGDTDIKNRLLDSGGEGEGGMIWENSIETYILPYVKQMTSASSMHERHSNKHSGAPQRDRVGREVGQDGAHMCTRVDSCRHMAETTTYCKVIILHWKLIN